MNNSCKSLHFRCSSKILLTTCGLKCTLNNPLGRSGRRFGPHPQRGGSLPLIALRALEDEGFSVTTNPQRVTQPRHDQDSDVVIVAALRTPFTKAHRGGLKDTDAIDLTSTVLRAVLEKTQVDPRAVGDVVIGSVLGSNSQRFIECRTAALLAGLPKEVPLQMVNRQCSSSLQALANVAASIKAGYYHIGIAGGVETMSIDGMKLEPIHNPRVVASERAQAFQLSPGQTSDILATRFDVGRLTQDQFALMSQERAAAAQAAGRFEDEIVPTHTTFIDPHNGVASDVWLKHDDGVRKTSAHILSRLPSAFNKDGTTTAGNSSQMTDGAGAVMLMTRYEARRRGLDILGTFRSFAVVGVDPTVMGVGPSAAIPEAVAKAGLQLSDIDLFEINEAFASQATYCINKLGLDMSKVKVNPNGGAIALGHPLGATGARLTATLLREMRRRGGEKGARYGVVSMCMATGMGAAAVFESGCGPPMAAEEAGSEGN